MVIEIPRNIKFGRTFKVRLNQYEVSKSHNFVFANKLGLMALESCKFRYFHLKSIIALLKFIFKKRIHFQINVSFCVPVTKKPEQTRMGKGKGKRIYWEAIVKKGMIILEIGGLTYIPNLDLLNSLISVKYRMPMKCKFVRLIY